MKIVFAVPVHERHQLAFATLRRLREVCDELGDATACVGGLDTRFQDLCRELGFVWVNCANDPLGRKWNDIYQIACMKLGAEYVVPLGSDDVVHPSFFDRLPPDGQIGCTRYSAMVSPDGDRIVTLNITYPGGDGVRILPRSLLKPFMFRPCIDERHRAIDGSVTQHMQLTGRPPVFDYRTTDPLAIIDFKTKTPDQRNTFVSCLSFRMTERTDVFEAVAEWHGERFAREVMAVYAREPVAA